ncbi:MAG: hypothetical protein ACI31G_00665 [Bacilli bacterium]
MELNSKINKVAKIFNIILSIISSLVFIVFLIILLVEFFNIKEALRNDSTTVNGYAIVVVFLLISSLTSCGINVLINGIYTITINVVNKNKLLTKTNVRYSVFLIFIPLILELIFIIILFALSLAF